MQCNFFQQELALPAHAYQHAAVASSSGTCSGVGRDVLKQGGSAVDAAVAVEFCLGVVLCHNTGVGGGGFALVFNKGTGKVSTFNFREKAPLKATRDMLVNTSLSDFQGKHS